MNGSISVISGSKNNFAARAWENNFSIAWKPELRTKTSPASIHTLAVIKPLLFMRNRVMKCFLNCGITILAAIVVSAFVRIWRYERVVKTTHDLIGFAAAASRCSSEAGGRRTASVLLIQGFKERLCRSPFA